MATSEQMPLPLPHRTALERSDFLASACNRDALAAVDGWHDWPGGRLALVGPARAGKSHLAAVWRAMAEAALCPADRLAEADVERLSARALVVEDVSAIDRAPRTDAAERALLHLMNRAGERRSPLLLTGRQPPSRWPVRLPDLASRLAALPVARIAAPDDALLSCVLVKLMSDRQLTMPPEVVDYLLPRMERSFAAADRIVAALDRASLARRARVTRRLAAEVLGREPTD